MKKFIGLLICLFAPISYGATTIAISALPSTNAVTYDAVLPLVQNGVTYKGSWSNLVQSSYLQTQLNNRQATNANLTLLQAYGPTTWQATNANLTLLQAYGPTTWQATNSALPLSAIGASFDGGGIVVPTGAAVPIVAYCAQTITGWSIAAAGTSPTCTFDVWKIASGTALPTVSNTIMGTKPVLATGNVIRSTTLTGWSTLAVAAGDIIIINLDSVTNATQISFTLETTR